MTSACPTVRTARERERKACTHAHATLTGPSAFVCAAWRRTRAAFPAAPFLDAFVAFEKDLDKATADVAEAMQSLDIQVAEATALYQSRLTGLHKFSKVRPPPHRPLYRAAPTHAPLLRASHHPGDGARAGNQRSVYAPGSALHQCWPPGCPHRCAACRARGHEFERRLPSLTRQRARTVYGSLPVCAIVGEQLDALDRQRLQALEAAELLRYFMDFQSGRRSGIFADPHRKHQVCFPPLPFLRGGRRGRGVERNVQAASAACQRPGRPTSQSNGPDRRACAANSAWRVCFRHAPNRRQAAGVAKRLKQIAADAESATTAQARVNIEAYCREVEETLLKQFEDATAEGDEEMMQLCARTLFDFNGGKAAAQQYIERHPLVVKDRTVAMRRMNEQWFNRSHNLLALKAVCDEVRETVAQEKRRLDFVFPNGPAVLAQLAYTLVRNHVNPYVTTLLSITVKGVLREEDDKTLQYLPTLRAAHQVAGALFTDLQAYNVDGWLDTKVLQDECFGTYLHRGAYADEEGGHLQASYLELLTPFMRYKASRKSHPKARGSTFAWSSSGGGSAATANAAGGAAGSSSTAALADSIGSNFGADETLSVEIALEMIHEHGHAIERAKELCSAIELPELVLRLFKVQLSMLGNAYIEAALDITLEQLAAARDSKAAPPLVTVLESIQAASSIVHLMQKHFQEEVLPCLAHSAAAHREAMLAKNRVLATVEVLINSCLDFLLYGVFQAFGRILAKQKKADYRPKEMAEAAATSPVCQECIVYLHKVYTSAKKCLDGKNLHAFLFELSLGLHRLMMEHIRKFTFNNAGGLLLARYVRWRRWRCWRCWRRWRRWRRSWRLGRPPRMRLTSDVWWSGSASPVSHASLSSSPHATSELSELQHSVRAFGIPEINQKYGAHVVEGGGGDTGRGRGRGKKKGGGGHCPS